jgi:uncharacterized protein (DUF736 family)
MAIEKDNTGSLWNNDNKEEGDKRPNMTGQAKVNGQMMRVAAWNNTSKKGKEYVGLSFEEHQVLEEKEDEVPF